jgi:hypothetical protein
MQTTKQVCACVCVCVCMVKPYVNGVPDASMIIALAFGLTCGISLFLAACSVYDNWLPCLAIFFILPAPFANFMTMHYATLDVISVRSDLVDFGAFVSAVLMSSAVGFLIVLLRVGAITFGAFALSISGAAVMNAFLSFYTTQFLLEPFDDL